jgi:hypothetical protein
MALLAGSGARAASAPAPTGLYYEAQTGPRSFAIDELHLSVRRPSTQVVALRNANVFGIAVGGRSIYWSTQSGPRDRVRLPAEAGGGVADGLTSDGRHLYFSRCPDNTIGRVDLNGSHVHQRFISVGRRSCPQGLAAAGGHIFWTELGQGIIGRASLDGRGVKPRWLNIDSRQGPFQVAVGGGHVYWTWGGENGSPSYTGRATVNRSHQDRRFLPDSMYPMALAG